MDSITNWDLGSLETYYSIEPCEKFQEGEFLDISLVPLFQAKLWKAQSRIKELEAEKFGSSEEKNRCFIKNQIKGREQNTDDPLVDYLMEKLNKEWKERERVTTENSGLKKKILDMESSTNRLRRERDIMEKVCEELLTRIDNLKTETRKIWDDTEEEKRMLHIAEMWREERVRVKLTDANLALQEKYEEMNWFVDKLEKSLVMVREVGGIEEISLRRGKCLIKAARSMEVVDKKRDVEEFEFVFNNIHHN